MSRTLPLSLLLLFFAAWPGRAHAQSEAFQRGYQAAREDLAKQLFDLTKWCHQKQLYLERDRLYVKILEIDPNHKETRKAMGSTRAPDGTWKTPALKEAKNRNEKALEELPAQIKQASAGFRDALLALLRAEQPDAALRTKTYDEILAWDPDDERVRKLLDQVKLDDAWVMPETAAAKARRAEIKALAAESKANVAALKPIQPTPADARLAESWASSAGAEGVRVFSTGDLAETEETARSCEAVVGFANKLFGLQAKLPANYTIYVLTSADLKDSFLSRIPGLKPEQREFFRSLMGCGVPGTPNIGVWYPEAKARVDCCVRQTLGQWFREAYGVTTQRGWVFEGMGLYLTRELIGTRLTWFATAAPTGENLDQTALRALLMATDANWMSEALKCLTGTSAPNLEEMMAKDVNLMDMRDMLAAYALSAYLLEGRAPQAADLVRRCGRGEKPATAVQASLGLTMEQLQSRLTNWLKERR